MTHDTHPAPTDEELRALERYARRRAKAQAGWLVHAAVYVGVNLLLAALAATRDQAWAMAPALGWGLGLLVHGAAVWLRGPWHGLGGWRERLVERERRALLRAHALRRGQP